MAKGGGGEPNGQTDLHLIPKTRHPAPRISLFLSLSLQQALPLVTQLRLSRARLPVAEKMKKQRTYKNNTSSCGKAKENETKRSGISKKLQNPKREKRFSPDTFVINTLPLFSWQTPHSVHLIPTGVRRSAATVSLARGWVCVCALLCRRFLARETTTQSWPEPKTEPQMQTRTRNEPHMRAPTLPEPNSGPRQSVPNLMRA